MNDDILPALEAAFSLVREVVQAIRDGATDEEVRARLADPGGVGQRLIDAVRSRRSRLRDYVEGG